MDVGAAFVPGREAAKAMQPGESAFDDPALSVPNPPRGGAGGAWRAVWL